MPSSLGRTTAVAVAVAAVILVTAVLPAEYGIDPLGTARVARADRDHGASIGAGGIDA